MKPSRLLFKGKRLLWLSCCVLLLFLVACRKEGKDYGVFLGVDAQDIRKLSAYRTIVVEPEEFGAAEVAAFHQQGKTVYAYVNVGALEEYRSYFPTYRAYLLGPYKDWPDEYWVDVSQESWQRFIVDDLIEKYVSRGYDGFFLDNFDVSSTFPQESIYEGLRTILQEMKKIDTKILLNGADIFVSRLMANGEADLFDGVNQETVFTSIDFQKDSYGENTPPETEYFLNYLQKVKEAGKEVYLLEYGDNHEALARMKAYCNEKAYHWFVAKDYRLREASPGQDITP